MPQPDQPGDADSIARREVHRGAGVRDGFDRHRLEAARRGTTFEEELERARCLSGSERDAPTEEAPDA